MSRPSPMPRARHGLGEHSGHAHVVGRACDSSPACVIEPLGYVLGLDFPVS